MYCILHSGLVKAFSRWPGSWYKFSEYTFRNLSSRAVYLCKKNPVFFLCSGQKHWSKSIFWRFFDYFLPEVQVLFALSHKQNVNWQKTLHKLTVHETQIDLALSVPFCRLWFWCQTALKFLLYNRHFPVYSGNQIVLNKFRRCRNSVFVGFSVP